MPLCYIKYHPVLKCPVTLQPPRFGTAVVELRGVNETHRIEKPYGGKNISTLCDLFADSVRTGVFHSLIPHPDRLRMPCLILASGIPPGNVHIMHSAIMKRRTFKNISTLCDLFADSVRTGVFHSRLPLMRDSAIASEFLRSLRKSYQE